MKCKLCGKELNQYADICDNCGNITEKKSFVNNFFHKPNKKEILLLLSFVIVSFLIYAFLLKFSPNAFYTNRYDISSWDVCIKISAICIFYILDLKRNFRAYFFLFSALITAFPYSIIFISFLFFINKNDTPRGF